MKEKIKGNEQTKRTVNRKANGFSASYQIITKSEKLRSKLNKKRVKNMNV